MLIQAKTFFFAIIHYKAALGPTGSFQDVQGEQELALRKALSVRLTQFQALAAEALAEVHLATGAVEPAPRAQGVGAQSPVRRDSVADAPPAAAQMMEKTAQDDERTMERPAQMIVEVAKFGPSCLPPQEARYKVTQERMDRAYIAGIHAGRALRNGGLHRGLEDQVLSAPSASKNARIELRSNGAWTAPRRDQPAKKAAPSTLPKSSTTGRRRSFVPWPQGPITCRPTDPT